MSTGGDGRISGIAFFKALVAKSTDADVVARHELSLSLGAKTDLIFVYNKPSLQVEVAEVAAASPRVRPRASTRPVVAASAHGLEKEHRSFLCSPPPPERHGGAASCWGWEDGLGCEIEEDRASRQTRQLGHRRAQAMEMGRDAPLRHR